MMSSELPLSVDVRASEPLVAQLVRQLTWLIATERLPGDHELPPVRELAEQLGINVHTVRAAYRQLDANGLVSLRRGRRTRVLTYDRARSNPSTTTLPTFSVGVILPELSAFYAPFLRGIEAAAADRATMTFICNAHEDPATALAYFDRLVVRHVDGIIVAGPLLEPDLVPTLPTRPRVVIVDAPGTRGASVEFELEEAQFSATSHLIEHGHRRIGYLSPPLNLANVSPKYVGYQNALRTAGARLETELVVELPDFQIRSGEAGAHHLLDLPDPPTAIAAASDSLALGAVHAITSRGLRIPDDVALVGNDDIEMASIIRPALTTVTLPVEEAGRRAVALLVEMSRDVASEPNRVVLPTSLAIRETCGCLKAERS